MIPGSPLGTKIQALAGRQSSGARRGLSSAQEPSGDPLRALAFAGTDPPILYAGGLDSGLWQSTDDGQTWQVAQGMSVGTIRALAAADGERVIVYVGLTSGALSGPGLTAAWANADLTLLGSGVYRLTTLLPTERLYLPLVSR